jgi:hypothetical protein
MTAYDQAASSDQALLRHIRKRGEDANLDRAFGLRVVAIVKKPRPLYTFATDSLSHPLRESAYATGTFRNPNHMRQPLN